MGLLDFLCSRKERVSPSILARATADAAMAAAFGADASLDARLRRLDAAPTVPSDQYFLELLVVALFPHDLLLGSVHGNRAYTTRWQARRAVLAIANESRTQVGAQGIREEDWMHLTDSRFAEYSIALQQDGGFSAQGMQRFAFAAAVHVSATDNIDPGTAIAIASSFSTTMRQFRPVVQRLEIIGESTSV